MNVTGYETSIEILALVNLMTCGDEDLAASILSEPSDDEIRYIWRHLSFDGVFPVSDLIWEGRPFNELAVGIYDYRSDDNDPR